MELNEHATYTVAGAYENADNYCVSRYASLSWQQTLPTDLKADGVCRFATTQRRCVALHCHHNARRSDVETFCTTEEDNELRLHGRKPHPVSVPCCLLSSS